MTHSEQEEALRRALRAVADTIEPAPDGLERIRERLSRPRPLAVAWLMAGWTGTAQPLLLRMEPVLAGVAGGLSDRLGEWLRLMLGALRAAAERLRPAGARLRPAGARLRLAAERLRPVGELLVDAIRMLRPGSGMSRHEKLRSALAFGAAALIGVASGFALSGGLQPMISTVGQVFSVFSSSSPDHASSSGPGSGLTKGQQPLATPPGRYAPGSTRSPSTGPSPTCSSTPHPSTDPSPTSPSPTSPSPTSPSPTSPSPTSPSPTSPSPTSPSPTSPSPTQTTAGPGSTPAANATATVGTGGGTATPSATNTASPSATNPASRVGNRGSGGDQPGATSPAGSGSTVKPSPSTGTSGCSG